MLAVTFGLLFLYWILRIIFCSPSTFLKTGHVFFATLSLGLFLILPKNFAWQSILFVTAALSISLIRHLKKPRSAFKLSSLFGWCSLYFVGTIAALLAAVFQPQEQVVGRVILKGHDQSTWMSWQNPSQSRMESSWIPSYEVEVQDAKGRKLYSDYIVGDYVAVRAQIISMNWPYQLLGFSHLYRLEMVHNGYANAQRHQLFPHMAYALPFPAKIFEKLWNRLFNGKWKIPGVKSSSLESSFFPLREAHLKPTSRSYDLVIGPTGLSSRISSQQLLANDL